MTRAGAVLLIAALAAQTALPALPAQTARAARPAPVLAATPIARLDLPWWRARFAAKQAAIAAGRYDLVYYGDSITQNFERAGTVPGSDWPSVWRHFYGDRHALNLGFKGDTTASLLWRIEHGEGAVRGTGGDPKVAIVLIGANNLGRLHWPAAATLQGIDADLAAIRRHLPRTKILLLGVLPSDRSAWVTETTRAINQGLARRYGSGEAGAVPGVVFVDAAAALQRDGRTDDSLFIDPALTPPDPPLHPNATGAARVAAFIEPTLARLLGDRRH